MLRPIKNSLFASFSGVIKVLLLAMKGSLWDVASCYLVEIWRVAVTFTLSYISSSKLQTSRATERICSASRTEIQSFFNESVFKTVFYVLRNN